MSIEILRDILGIATRFDSNDKPVFDPDRMLHIDCGTLDKALNEYADVRARLTAAEAKLQQYAEPEPGYLSRRLEDLLKNAYTPRNREYYAEKLAKWREDFPQVSGLWRHNTGPIVLDHKYSYADLEARVMAQQNFQMRYYVYLAEQTPSVLIASHYQPVIVCKFAKGDKVRREGSPHIYNFGKLLPDGMCEIGRLVHVGYGRKWVVPLDELRPAR